MGRSSLIAVLGFIVIFGMVRQNINKTSEASQLNSSIFTESVLARHVTNIAANYVMSIHSQTGETDSTFSDSSFLGGSYTASITTLGQNSTLDFDTLLVSVTGSYEDESHTTSVQFISRSLLLPPISASIAIESTDIDFDIKQNAQIRGIDTNMDGSTGPGPDLAGITVSSQSDSAFITSLVAADPSLVEGNPITEVMSDSSPVNLDQLVDLYKDLADYTYENGMTFTGNSWGTADDPIIVYCASDCEMRNGAVGYGILVVSGEFEMKNGAQWFGYVIITNNSEEVELKNSAQIFGALHIGASVTEIEIKSFADIFYSSEAINMVRSKLVSGGNDVRIITEKIWYE